MRLPDLYTLLDIRIVYAGRGMRNMSPSRHDDGMFAHQLLDQQERVVVRPKTSVQIQITFWELQDKKRLKG
jgi:hypothetical protein